MVICSQVSKLIAQVTRKVTTMARPKGMRKVDGIWYMPNGEIAPSCKNITRAVIDRPAVKTEYIPAPVVSTPAVTKVQGAHLYSAKDRERVENQTGLTYAGSFAIGDGTAMLIPVFLRADRDQERRDADMANIRRG